MPRVPARRPYDHDHAARDVSGADIAPLAIVLSIIDDRGVESSKQLFRIDEIETASLQHQITFDGVEADHAEFMYVQKWEAARETTITLLKNAIS